MGKNEYDKRKDRFVSCCRCSSLGFENEKFLCNTPAEAAQVILKFYRNYHSSRYVKDDYVIRLKKPLHQKDVERLADEFKVLIKTGSMTQRGAFDLEEDNRELPRLAFHHTRHRFGMIRQLIDRINQCDPA